MSWVDISVPITPDLTTYGDDPPVRIMQEGSIAAGDEVNISRLDLSAHTGTHVDAPRHFIEGAGPVDEVPLDALIGPAWVVDATAVDAIVDAPALAGLAIPDGERRILFKTRNSELWERDGFVEEFVALDAAAALALVERGVVLVGIDYLSIAPFGDAVPTHKALLAAGVAILEGLDLSRVEPGPYELICLPLRVAGGDGAPARAVLRPRDGATTGE